MYVSNKETCAVYLSLTTSNQELAKLQVSVFMKTKCHLKSQVEMQLALIIKSHTVNCPQTRQMRVYALIQEGKSS